MSYITDPETISVEPGASAPLICRWSLPEEAGGGVSDLTGFTSRLTIHHRGVCHEIWGDLDVAKGEFSFDLNNLTLAPRVTPYRAVVYLVHDGLGGPQARRAKDINIQILKGC